MTEEISTYKVKQEIFEGPLGLLLSLIERRKLFVNEVSLAQVTNDYVAYIKSISDVSPEKRIADISYFILTAATLILIKSKSLLPNLDLTEEETGKIEDLEVRLKLYKTIKEASISIQNNFGTRIIFGPVDRSWGGEPLFVPEKSINIKNVQRAIGNVITHMPKPEIKKPSIEIKKIINIDEVINSLSERIQNAVNLSFKEFSESHGAKTKQEARVHVIVSFLAMLELVREGIIDVIQNSSFGDIEINKQLLKES